MTITTTITAGTSSKGVLKIIKEDEHFIPLKNLNLADMVRCRLSKIFIDGKWEGCTR